MTHDYSASQLKNFAACPRRWFFEKVLKYVPERSDGQNIGSIVHNGIEEYFKNGTAPEDQPKLDDITRVYVKKAIKSLPAPNPNLEIEKYVKMPLSTGGTFRGFIDMVDTRNPDNPLVIDHKVLASFKWAITEAELPDDIQMMSYAYFMLRENPSCKIVTVAHHVIPKTKQEPRWISFTTNKKHVEKKWSSYLHVIDNMEACWEQTDVREIDPLGQKNGECEKYRGCPHLSMCTMANLGKPIAPNNVDNETPNTETKITKEPKMSKTTKTKTLYINCRPIKNAEELTDFADWVKPLTDKIKASSGNSWQLIEYGKGKGVICDLVEAQDLPDNLYIDKTTQLGNTVLEILKAKADYIVQGE